MEKTKEQKLTSKIAQVAKAIEMLQSNKLYDFLDGLKYTYSLIRYKKNHREFIEDATYFDYFKKVQAKTPLNKCLKAGILKPWSDTYWFDKDKAESLQQYILEHQN